MFTTIGIGWLISILRETSLLKDILGSKRVTKLVFDTPQGDIEVQVSDITKIFIHCD